MPDVLIETLGKQGDGIATLGGKRCFVPNTLPGETVRVSGSGQRLGVDELIRASPERVDAQCRHFGRCGGCQLQHLESDAYAQWKRNLLVACLQAHGLDFVPRPLERFPVASRRKAVFNARRVDRVLSFGFAERGSEVVVDLEECPVLCTELETRLPALRALAASLPIARKPVRIAALMSEQGCDVDIEGGFNLTPQQRNALINKAISTGFARLSHNGEILIEPNKPLLKMGSAMVVPPPGAFVQAVEAVEHAMSTLVTEHLAGSKRVADLYCGVGTFALRLAEYAPVLAVEDNQAALSALDQAWRQTAGRLREITCEKRNLERRPVSFQELKKIDGLVFDPPRAGAELQTRQIAKSKVQRVAAVSCNPQTLARDLAILVDGGYTIREMVPIDQFPFTPHLETVALLSR